MAGFTSAFQPLAWAALRFHAWDASGEVCRFCGGHYLEVDTSADGCAAHTPDRCDDHCYRSYLTPEDRAELASLLNLERIHQQGVSIAASSDYYTEYVARAAGIEAPAVIGVPYWD